MAELTRTSWALVLTALVLAQPADGQIRAPSFDPALHKNSLGFGGSAGTFYRKGSYFFGAGLNYGRVIKGPWVFGLGVAWDREINTPESAPSTQVNSLTAIPTITYLLNDTFSLTTGIGQGFGDDDNPAKSMKLTKGGTGSGAALGIALPDVPGITGEDLGLSVAWEYSFSEAQPSISVDLSMSWGF